MGSISGFTMARDEDAGAFIARMRWLSSMRVGRIGEKARRKGLHIKKAPDIVVPSFLSVGKIIVSRELSSAFCVDEEGVVVLFGENRSV
jgi:hypothetical protein